MIHANKDPVWVSTFMYVCIYVTGLASHICVNALTSFNKERNMGLCGPATRFALTLDDLPVFSDHNNSEKAPGPLSQKGCSTSLTNVTMSGYIGSHAQSKQHFPFVLV